MSSMVKDDSYRLLSAKVIAVLFRQKQLFADCLELVVLKMKILWPFVAAGSMFKKFPEVILAINLKATAITTFPTSLITLC